MLPGIALVLAILVAYVQALGGPLVWDDRPLILGSPLLAEGAPLSAHLGQPLWAGQGSQPASLSYYRPLVTLSFALDHRIHGTNAGGFHLSNIVFHLAAAVALYCLLQKHGVRQWSAAGCAAAWALLPRLAEAAAWVSGRTDALAGALSLWALFAWGPAPGRRVVAAVLFGAALLSKESAVAVLAALACVEWMSTRRGESLWARWQQTSLALLPLLLVLMTYLALRLSMIGYEDDHRPLGLVVRARTVLEAIFTYLLMLLDPLRPRALIGRAGAVTIAGSVGGLLVVVGGLAAWWRFRARIGQSQALGLSLLVCALLPVIHLVPVPIRTLSADRFLYLPAAGLVLALAPSLDRLLDRFRAARILGLVALSALLAGAVHRVGVWSDEIEFWVETNLTAPTTNNAAAIEFAGVFLRAGFAREALELSERAVRSDDPHKQTALHNAAVCLAHLGRSAEALSRLLESTRGRVTARDAGLVAFIQLRAGDYAAAEAGLQRLATAGAGGAKAMLVRLPALIAAYRELASLDGSGDPERRARLASELGDYVRATPAWKEATLSPAASKATMLAGLGYLLRTPERDAITRVTHAYSTRFGPFAPELAVAIEVRLAEIDALGAAAERVGLRR